MSEDSSYEYSVGDLKRRPRIGDAPGPAKNNARQCVTDYACRVWTSILTLRRLHAVTYCQRQCEGIVILMFRTSACIVLSVLDVTFIA